MHYREVFAAIEGVTSADGPFPIIEQEVDGIPQKVFGGLPDNLRDYFAFCASHGDKECLIDRDRRLSFAAVAKQVTSLGAALAGQYGRHTRRAAEELAEAGYYYCASSDAHRVKDLGYVEQGIRRLFDLMGKEEAEFLLAEGPASVLDGTVED